MVSNLAPQGQGAKSTLYCLQYSSLNWERVVPFPSQSGGELESHADYMSTPQAAKSPFTHFTLLSHPATVFAPHSHSSSCLQSPMH